MSARTRRKSVRKRKPSKNKSRFSLRGAIFGIIVTAAFLGILIFGLSSKDDSKVVVSYFSPSGASVLVFDLYTNSITKLSIPEDTQLESAYNLGVLKLKNLDKVSENEGLGSALLSKTLTKNLHVPILYHSGKDMESYFEGSLARSLMDAIVARDTNLGLVRRLRLALFSSKVINSKRISLDISNYSFVSNTQLTDGSSGFVILRDTPASIISLVSDSRLSSSGYTSRVINGVGDKELIGNAVQTIKNSGLVVTSIENTNEDLNCQVRSENQELLDYFVTLFGCEKILTNTQTDVEIVFGERFRSNF